MALVLAVVFYWLLSASESSLYMPHRLMRWASRLHYILKAAQDSTKTHLAIYLSQGLGEGFERGYWSFRRCRCSWVWLVVGQKTKKCSALGALVCVQRCPTVWSWKGANQGGWCLIETDCRIRRPSSPGIGRLLVCVGLLAHLRVLALMGFRDL